MKTFTSIIEPALLIVSILIAVFFVIWALECSMEMKIKALAEANNLIYEAQRAYCTNP